MPYSVEIPPSVKAYLRDLPGLSRTARVKLAAYVHGFIRETTDDYRNDPVNRSEAGPPYLRYQCALLDNEDGRVHLFDFIVKDASAYGVLQLVYVEHTPGRTFGADGP